MTDPFRDLGQMWDDAGLSDYLNNPFGQPLKVNVNRCPRCGGSHKRILFDYNPGKEREWTHTGTCPVRGGILFLKRTKGKGAKVI